MAIARTDRGPLSHTSTSGTAQSATSGSFTPTQGRVLVVTGTVVTGNSTADLSVDDTFGAAVDDWTIIKSNVAIAYGTPSLRAFVAWAYVSGSPASGTVTVRRTNSGSTECFIAATVVEVSGTDPSPVRQQVTNNTSGGGSTISANLPSAPLASGYTIGVAADFWGNPTAPTGTTTLDFITSYSSSIVHRAGMRTVEDTTPTQNHTFGSLNGDAAAAVMVELWEPQTVSDDADAVTAEATATAYDATAVSSIDADAESAEATASALDATIVTQSNTPSPDTASASGFVFAPKLEVESTIQVASASASALDATAAVAVEAHAEVALAEGVAFDTIGDVIEPPIVVPVSDVDLLEMNVSQRRESFRFDLLDKAGNVIGEVHPLVPCKITNNTSQAIKRRVTNFVLAPSEHDDVNTLSDRVRPVMVLQNGNEYPLGVFLFADASNSRFSYGQTLDGTLVDQNLILGQPLSSVVSFEQGTLVVDAMRQVYERAGISNAVIDASSADIGSAVAWQAGKSDTYIKVLDDLAALAGFYPPYFDNVGVPRARVAVDLETSTPQLVYADGDGTTGRIIAGSIVAANDLLNAPNRYIVIDTSATINPVVATYDLPATAPHAVVHRGFAIPRIIEAPGVGNVDQALALAQLTAQTELRTFESIHFQSPTDPRHDTFDVVSFLGNTYMEVSWAITCSPGGPMEHEINRQYVTATIA